MIWRLLRFLILLAVLAIIGLIGYSYSGLMVPETRTVTEPVELNGD